MGDISEHFSRAEFACRCRCGFDEINPRLVEILEEVRNHFDLPCKVNSGCRCIEHNRIVRGAPRSQHLLGNAADVVIKGVSPALVAEAAILYGATGTKVYNTFTHIDVRPGDEWHEH